ncbi:MAG: VOC family protein [Actinomycetota bacterium]
MTEGMRTIIYPVTDTAQAKAVYAALLGVAPSMDEPWYVAFDVGGQHLGLDPRGHDRGMTGPVGYWHVGDIEVTLASLVAAGATLQQEVTDVGGGKLIATVKDADGNLTGLIQNP